MVAFSRSDSMSGESGATLQLSAYAEQVLRGATFDARKMLQRPRRTADTAEQEEEERRWRATVRILDYLNSGTAQLTYDTLSWMEDKIMGVAKHGVSCSREADYWNSTYMKIGRIPKYWKAEWLVTHYASDGLDAQTLARVDEKDSGAVGYIFDFATATHAHMHLPRPMLRKKLCNIAFKGRADSVNRITKEWVENAIAADGSVNWQAHGVFRFKKCEDETVDLIHVSGSTVKWDTAIDIFAKNIQLELNVWDSASKITVGKQDLPLCRLFEKKVGPNTDELMNPRGSFFNAFAEKLAEELAKKEKVEDFPTVGGGQGDLHTKLDENLKRKRAAAVAQKSTKRKKLHQTLVGTLVV